MNFHIGQEIVCIVEAGEWWRLSGDAPIAMPEKGEVYHCAGYAESFVDCCPAIYLQEFPGGWNFEACGFRPVIKTDISELEEIARKATRRGRVDA